jgi:hypothetical protein
MASERKEHVDEAGFCRHCMATVDGDGYAVAEQEQLTPYEGDETEQQSSTVAMRDNAGGDFASAVRNYAEGGEVEENVFEKKMRESDKESAAILDSSPTPESAKQAAEELKRKKMERYGRMGR